MAFFDGFLFLAENETVTAYVSGALLVIGGLFYITALRLSLKAIKCTLRYLKKCTMEKPTSLLTITKATASDIPLYRQSPIKCGLNIQNHSYG